MTVLGYSELLKRITDINQEKLETPFVILNKNNTTQKRLGIIKALAKYEPVTIGMLLQKIHMPRGGGSYLTVKKYFGDLEKEGLLKKIKKGNKTYWSFSEKFQDIKRFIIR